MTHTPNKNWQEYSWRLGTESGIPGRSEIVQTGTQGDPQSEQAGAVWRAGEVAFQVVPRAYMGKELDMLKGMREASVVDHRDWRGAGTGWGWSGCTGPKDQRMESGLYSLGDGPLPDPQYCGWSLALPRSSFCWPTSLSTCFHFSPSLLSKHQLWSWLMPP